MGRPSTKGITGPEKKVNDYWQGSYKCRHCKASSVTYFIWVTGSEKSISLTKVGQWPPLLREPAAAVVKGWNKEDVRFYREALTLRNHGKGIAALPYLRRVIETHIQQILDLLNETNAVKPIRGFEFERFSQARESRRFSDKLDFARDYLPEGLTPKGGPNPIGLMYELIRDGLHARSEAECVAIFDRCQTAFVYVIDRLASARAKDQDYLDAIRKLTDGK